jgi:hypothetical protein
MRGLLGIAHIEFYVIGAVDRKEILGSFENLRALVFEVLDGGEVGC